MFESKGDVLSTYASDFSNLHYAMPNGLYRPNSVEEIQKIIKQANQSKQKLTIRCQGLSQGGQAIADNDSHILSVENLRQLDEVNDDYIWASAANTWQEVLNKTLPHRLAPVALPYNCQLSISGILSAGGMGAAAFKYGPMVEHIRTVAVVDGRGDYIEAGHDDALYQAVLAGQGNFGVITKAAIKLRPIQSKVKTWCLLFYDLNDFIRAIETAREHFDYIESFCSASPQGAIVLNQKRQPLNHWLYGLHVSLEFDNKEPENQMVEQLNAPVCLHYQCEPVDSFLLRHNHRFDAMRGLGQWSMMHPWFECYLDKASLEQILPTVLAKIPVPLAPFIHLIPIKPISNKQLMFPESGPVYSFMILNPGLPLSFKSMAIETVTWLNELMLSQGGKRYLSGFQGEVIDSDWWVQHFGNHLSLWQSYKKQFDPNHIFTSKLFQQIPAQ